MTLLLPLPGNRGIFSFFHHYRLSFPSVFLFYYTFSWLLVPVKLFHLVFSLSFLIIKIEFIRRTYDGY